MGISSAIPRLDEQWTEHMGVRTPGAPGGIVNTVQTPYPLYPGIGCIHRLCGASCRSDPSAAAALGEVIEAGRGSAAAGGET